jgi:hypothetical protein
MKKKLLLLSILCTTSTFFAQTFSFAGIFYNVTGLTTVEVSNPNYLSGAITIPETVIYGTNSYTVTRIGADAFSASGDLLTSINIPNSVTSIGGGAFSFCTNLNSVNIPHLVTNIEFSAFQGCSALTSVIIPNSVTSIGNFAFADCSALQSFTVNWSTPLPITYFVFQGTPLSSATLYVPAGTEALYEAADYWTLFGNLTFLGTNSFSIDKHINLYPNPSTNYLNIDIKDLNNGQVNILDNNGKVLVNQILKNTSNSIDISGLSSGLYLFKIITSEGIFTKKVIKE